MIPVSVLIVTKNAADGLEATLESLEDFGEILIVDSNSTDGTKMIAAAHKVPVISYQWNGQYPKKRQWCLENVPTENDWILFVDADEIVTDALKREITETITDTPHAAFFLRGQPVFCGKRLNHGRWNNKIVLFRKGALRYPELPDTHTAMGEIEGHVQPFVDGTVGQLKNALIHETAENLDAWIDRHQRYAAWQADIETANTNLAASERGARRLAKTIFSALPLRPVMVFIDSYVWKKGALDGSAGFHYATARAFFYWMAAAKKTANANKRRETGT